MSYSHHIHLICDSQDDKLFAWHDALTMLFDERVRLTRDSFIMSNETTNYSWRCINQCDYVFVLVGERYGPVNASGVSQLHISYLNAKTKNKPMVAFILAGEHSKPVADLVGTIQEQLSAVHMITGNEEMSSLFASAYDDLVLGLHDFRPNKSAFAITHLSEAVPAVKETALVPVPTITQLDPPAKVPNLQDPILLHCTAHAFEGGTLIEVGFTARLSWHDILSALPQSFGMDSFSRTLNELVSPQAMPIIKTTHPNVHAISRCQVVKVEALWIHEELVNAHWIAKTTQGTREFWTITETARHLLTNPT